MPFGTAPGAAPSAAQPGALGQLAPNPFAVATAAELDFPEPKKKTGLIIGVVVLLVAAGVGIVLATSRSAPPAPPPVPTVVVPAPAETPPATATSTAATDSTPPSGPRTGGELPSGPAPTATGNDFSQMFAAGAEKAQKGEPTGTAKAFDAEEARTAIASVLKSVAACKEPGGPTGQANAAITFGAGGQVTGVTIGAPFAGTTTGTCIIGAFKAAKVAPFNGLPGTVSQPVSLL
jgi:hypothetical protein